jgi:hypothetical protein
MRSLRALALIAIIVALHARIWGVESVAVLVGNRPVLLPLALALMVSIAVHEALHLAGYVWIGGAPYSAVHVEWRGVVMVARCDVPISARSYRAAVALPGLLLGVLPTIAGLALGIASLTVYGAVMLGAALGDVQVLWELRGKAAGELVVARR